MKPTETTIEDKNDALQNEGAPTPTDDAAANDEFQVTIKKLEMPVRPRGVLAD